MRLIIVAAAAAVAGCASGQSPDPVFAASAAPPPAVAAIAATPERIGPAVDHHQHLLSPEAAAHERGEGPNPIRVPTDVARLLERRALAWNDARALADVYAEDAILVEDSAVSGRAEIAEYVSERFGRPYAITPLAYAEHRDIRQIGTGRILYGSDGAFGGNKRPDQAWGIFRGLVPLTDSEFAIIRDNVAPYLR